MFIEAKDDGGGGDNWSCKSCKARVKSLPPTNQHNTTFIYINTICIHHIRLKNVKKILPRLLQISGQLAHWWPWSLVCCHSLMTSLWWLLQLQSITTHWPVPYYTDWSKTHVVVVVEIFVHGAVTNAPQSQSLQMSLQQFLELADCRVGLMQWSRQTVPESGSSVLEGLVTEACVSAWDYTGGDIRWAKPTAANIWDNICVY